MTVSFLHSFFRIIVFILSSSVDHQPDMSSPLRIAFLHPDLGIGGAERLVVDAAVGLQSKGHSVVIYTSHHDRSHCFAETIDGTIDVQVRGDWLPRHFCGRFFIVFAILRSLFAAVCILLSFNSYDVLIVDQLSVAIPLLRLSRSKVLFYCHFPDQLLAAHKTFLQRLYRWPVDRIEEWTTGMAHLIFVNSQFTASVFKKTFARTLSHVTPAVLYPSINFDKFDKASALVAKKDKPFAWDIAEPLLFLSINRFERKKNIGLAIQALAVLLHSTSTNQEKEEEEDVSREFDLTSLPAPLNTSQKRRLQLVVAGGYDELSVENKEYYKELMQLATQLKLTVSVYPDSSGQVVFLRNFSDEERACLLSLCLAVVYTPTNEHFGIVPVEAMYSQRPVIAVASGGPLESVQHKATGFLCRPLPTHFHNAMLMLASDAAAQTRMGKQGRLHVRQLFSLDAFTLTLDTAVHALVRGEQMNTHCSTGQCSCIDGFSFCCYPLYLVLVFVSLCVLLTHRSNLLPHHSSSFSVLCLFFAAQGNTEPKPACTSFPFFCVAFAVVCGTLLNTDICRRNCEDALLIHVFGVLGQNLFHIYNSL